MKHTAKQLRFPEAPVEAVTEFRQVTEQVLWARGMPKLTPNAASGKALAGKYYLEVFAPAAASLADY